MNQSHITVRLVSGLHTPVMVTTLPSGIVQVSDQLPGEEDALSAKHEAVAWARRRGVPFVAPSGVSSW